MKEISSPLTTRLVLPLTVLLLCFTTTASARGPESTSPIQVGSGWNLLSLPLSVRNGRADSLFPSAISSAFVYDNGYQERDTMQNGSGFWLKFAAAETVLVQGEVILKDTIQVQAGWNIIGSLSQAFARASIQTWPPGIITGQIFEYTPGGGYQPADTLRPGLGYWVKSAEYGFLMLAAPGGPACPGMPTVDYAGRTYNTVLIGNRCWLKENLDVGTMIPGTQEQGDNSTIEKYCYGDDPAKCDTFGGLYQWDEALQYDTAQGRQGICPPGWHVPTVADYDTLILTVGGDGNALKAVGQGIGVGAGTNTSGFSALLGGFRNIDGTFGSLREVADVLSSTQFDASYAQELGLGAYDSYVYLFNGRKHYGFSVRCLYDGVFNQPPDTPSNPAPSDGSSGQSPSVMLGWSCSDPDGDPLTYDVYFGVVNPPDTMVSSDQADTTFGIGGLSGATTYYWKVVARDTHADTTSGPVWSFTTGAIGGSPCPGTPTVTYAGKTYNTVQIGAQCWLRENLDVGAMVLGSREQTENDTIEKYCYGDNPANCATYGGLYQWDEAMQYDTTPGVQGICPLGWHIPWWAEFQTLRNTVSEDGNALKATGQGGGAGAGTNTSGLSALLAGIRGSAGYFHYLGNDGYFWSSTQYAAPDALYLYLDNYSPDIHLSYNHKTYGRSVRCLKD